MRQPWRLLSDDLLHLRARVLISVVVLVCLAAGCTKEAKRDRHLKKANSYYAARQYQKAAIEYRNALRFDPESSFCVSRLATVYYEEGQLSRAFPLLLKAQKLDTKDIEVSIKLARMYSEAQAVPKARELAADILEKQPANEEAWLILSGTAVTAEEVADVERRVLQLRSQGGDRAALHLAAGMMSLRQKDLEKAELDFKKAFSLNPKSPSACRALGSVYLLRGKVDEARQEHEKEIKLAPQDFFARLRFAEFNLMTGALEKAKGILEAITKDAPDFVPARSYLAELAFEGKEYDACASLVTRVLAQSPEDYRALMLRAGLSMVKGDVGQGIQEFKRAKTLYARVPRVHFQLARAYLATNDVGNALASLEQAVTLNPNFTDALFLQGQLNLRKGDYGSAVSVFSQLATQNPQMAAAQIFLADAHRAHGTLDEALTIYRRLSTTFPTNAELPYLMGRVYRQQKKSKEAEQAFSKALGLNPIHLAALSQLVEMKIQQKDYQSARKLVDGALSRAPQSAEAWFMQARLTSAQGDVAGTETALLKTIELDTNSLAAAVALAKLYMDSNRGVQAISRLDEILTRAPNNLPALMQKATIHEKMSNYARAAESYEKILAIAPGFALALNNLACLNYEYLGKLDRANELATKAHELLPGSPEITDTLGWILYKQGDYSRSVGLLSEAAAKLPGSAEVQFHLGMAHYMQGEEKEAKALLTRSLGLSKSFPGAEEAQQRLAMLEGASNATDPQAQAKLEKLLAKQPDDPIGWIRLADLQIRDASWNKARLSLEQVIARNPQSGSALIKLARLYSEQLNNPDKALELAKRARGLAPNDLEIGHAFGRLTFQAGDHQWAVDALQAVVQKSPPQADLLFDFARALYSVGRVDEARGKMHQVLKLAPSSSNAAQAKQFLEMTDLAGNLDAHSQAASSVQAALKSQPNDVPALVVWAALQARKGDTKEARRTYEQILGRYPQFSPALKALVLLPEGSGNDRQSYEWAMKARKTFPSDPQVAKAVGRAMYKRGEYASASTALQDAVKSLTDDAEAHYYLGMTHYKLGKKQQARVNLQRASTLGLEGQPALDAMQVLVELK